MLGTRLALEQLPTLPELPSGTDNASTDLLSAQLIGLITELRATSGRLPDGVGEAVAGSADELEVATIAYVAALRAHDPVAEDLAVEVARADADSRLVITRWLDAESETLTSKVDLLVGSVASIR